MSRTPLVDTQPGVAAVDAEIAAEAASWDDWLGYVREMGAEDAREAAEHAVAVQQAIEDRTRPPAPPTPALPAGVHDGRLQRHRANEEALARSRLVAVASAGDAVLAAAQAEIVDATADAGPLLNALDAVLARVSVAQESVQAVWDARAVLASLREHRDRLPRPTYDSLAEAARSGVDLLAKPGRTRVLGSSTNSLLGLRPGTLHEPPDSAWEPPLPPEPRRVPDRSKMSLRDRFL